MSVDWREYLRLAEELADRSDDEAAMRSAISRAYYAAFNMAARHKAAAGAMSTQEGSHQSVWKTLKRSGNPSWRSAGNMGIPFMDLRHKADYSDPVASFGWESRKALGTANKILRLLSS